jgi:hypothetical protein
VCGEKCAFRVLLGRVRLHDTPFATSAPRVGEVIDILLARSERLNRLWLHTSHRPSNGKHELPDMRAARDLNKQALQACEGIHGNECLECERSISRHISTMIPEYQHRINRFPFLPLQRRKIAVPTSPPSTQSNRTQPTTSTHHYPFRSCSYICNTP